MTSTSSSFPANLHGDQWVTGNFNIMGNNPAPGAAKDLGNTIDATFPAAALVGSPFYDIFARGDPNAFATSPPHFEDSSRHSEPNPAVPTINWEGFFLVPPPRTTGNPANRAPVSFYDGVRGAGLTAYSGAGLTACNGAGLMAYSLAGQMACSGAGPRLLLFLVQTWAEDFLAPPCRPHGLGHGRRMIGTARL